MQFLHATQHFNPVIPPPTPDQVGPHESRHDQIEFEGSSNCELLYDDNVVQMSLVLKKHSMYLSVRHFSVTTHKW